MARLVPITYRLIKCPSIEIWAMAAGHAVGNIYSFWAISSIGLNNINSIIH